MARKKYYGIVWDYDDSENGFYRTGLKAVFRVFVILLSFTFLLPTYYTCLLFIYPLKYIHVELFWSVEGWFTEYAALIFSTMQWSADYTIATVGDNLKNLIGRRCLFILNHQSTADVMMVIHMMSSNTNVTRHQTSIMDWFIKYTPFGWFLVHHGEFFIQQGRDTELQRFANHVKDVFIPSGRKWYFVCPEGGFLKKRRARSQRYAKQNGYPFLQHVTLPRVGILEVILRLLSPQSESFIKSTPVKGGQQTTNNNYDNNNLQSEHGLDYLVDLTIGYPERTDLNLQTICLGTRNPCQTKIHIRKFPIANVPVENEALLQWMYRRFEEKERLLDVFYKTGSFPKWDPVSKQVLKGKLLSSSEPIRLSNTKIILSFSSLIAMFIFMKSFLWMPLINVLSF